MKDWPDYDGSVPVPETMTRPAVEVTGGPDPEWLALLDRARAGGEDAADAVGDAYSRGIRVGLRRAAEAILPAAVTTEETHELTAELVGLEPEQEIRARAAEIIGSPSQLTVDSAERWRRTVDQVADYIRDGSRPA